jgi:hypothetical protein
MSATSDVAGHAFLSYVREDKVHVDQLQQVLEAAGVPVWRDIRDLQPGQDWKLSIRRAIGGDTLAFVACFSRASQVRPKSYQNEELLLAIDQFRRRPPDQPWLIPVRFDDCDLPEFDLGAGRTLASLHRADIFGDTRADHTARLVETIRQILSRHPDAAITAAATAAPGVDVRITGPEDQDIGLRTRVESVVYITASEPIGDVTASYVTSHGNSGTAPLGYAPAHVSTRTWRIRCTYHLRSVDDVIIGYTVGTGAKKVQWFQWGGYDHPMPELGGSHLNALLTIRQVMQAR